jgi:hypothetical protein
LSDFFVFGLLSLAATALVWKLTVLAASKTDFQEAFLANSDKRVRLNALCRLVAVGAVTEEEARKTFAFWPEELRKYAEKNFGLLLEMYSRERNSFDGSGTLCGV